MYRITKILADISWHGIYFYKINFNVHNMGYILKSFEVYENIQNVAHFISLHNSNYQNALQHILLF